MTIKDRVNNEYFEWMFDLVSNNRSSSDISYRKLLMQLHNTEFVYSIEKDKNRASDGVNLRRRFSLSEGPPDSANYIHGPCSVLEMMIALSLRCEENIMDDPSVGNRTREWFWNMVVNLGLGSMVDSNYNKQRVTNALERFLNREYEPDGKGGLFTVKNINRDLRSVEIWIQMCWYLDERFYY